MKDLFTKQWIINNSVEIISRYDQGILTIRALHYQLVTGYQMTNDIQHYKRVVSAIIDARWDGIIRFDTFSDLDRGMVGKTESEYISLEDKVSEGKRNIRGWMEGYWRNKWENQKYYPEIFIEKKALQGVFQGLCNEWKIALGACKGYPSLTFLYESSIRFGNAARDGKIPIILYFGDYDPSGEDIPRSIQDNLYKFGENVEVRRIALMEHQVLEWNLPPAPAKVGDTRSANWGGLGQVELDAVSPENLMELLENSIRDIFDYSVYEDLLNEEDREGIEYREELKNYVNNL
jgi:hypothetical protein